MWTFFHQSIDVIVSTRNYILFFLSEKRSVTIRVAQYIIIAIIVYIVALFFLNKVYRFFVRSVYKQRSKFLLACDTILAETQKENKHNSQNIDWIQEIIKKGSYEQSYNVFLEKATNTDDLKKSYKIYNNAIKRKKSIEIFLIVITLGIYKVFTVN